MSGRRRYVLVLLEFQSGHDADMAWRTLARWEEAKVAEGVERGLAEGVERGVAQGRVALLRRLAALRFGTDVAGQAAALLANVTDVAHLDEAGKWLLECDTGEALLRRLRAGREGAGNGVPG